MSPSGLGGDFADFDRQTSPVGSYSPGRNPVDSSEKGAPVRELTWPSVLGEPLADCLQEPMSGEKNLEYAIQATVSVWMPFEQVYSVESVDVDFDSFGMAPWDTGGMNSRTLGEPDRTRMLQWLMRLLCRPVIMCRLNRTRTMYTENGLDTNMMIPTDSPRLTVTPGEWYGNDVFTQIRHEVRETRDNSAAVDCNAVIWNNLISRRLFLPPEEVSAGRDETNDFPETDCAAADSDAADMIDLICRRLRLLQEVSSGLDGTDDFPETDCAAAGSGAADMNDLIFRQLSLPPEEFAGGRNTAADAMKFAMMIFRRTKLPPDEFSAGRNGDYIWHDLGTEPSVCNRPVTGSHIFGSSHRLERYCLWRAALHIRGSFDGCLYTIPVLGRDLRCLCPAELPRCSPRTPLVSRASYDVDVPVHSLLCCCFLGYVFAERNSYDLVIILDSLWYRHPVCPDGGSFFAKLDMSLYDPCRWECRQLLALDPAVLRTPKFFRLILTFSYCLFYFLNGYPRRDIRDFYISSPVGCDCYEFFRGDSFPVGCSCWTTSTSNHGGHLFRY